MRGKGDELQYIVHSTYCIGHTGILCSFNHFIGARTIILSLIIVIIKNWSKGLLLLDYQLQVKQPKLAILFILSDLITLKCNNEIWVKTLSEEDDMIEDSKKSQIIDAAVNDAVKLYSALVSTIYNTSKKQLDVAMATKNVVQPNLDYMSDLD